MTYTKRIYEIEALAVLGRDFLYNLLTDGVDGEFCFYTEDNVYCTGKVLEWDNADLFNSLVEIDW